MAAATASRAGLTSAAAIRQRLLNYGSCYLPHHHHMPHLQFILHSPAGSPWRSPMQFQIQYQDTEDLLVLHHSEVTKFESGTRDLSMEFGCSIVIYPVQFSLVAQ
ncbi:hypothetical protein OsJ_09933 [Oryza sativa Japonica Group]|uniref:Uncharacterized protein n=2 Tax=Oryza TaxID=4527 RepID=B9F682_ORYSJ|nr:hypothetical protein OsJ_09933 [Oryza sativa Japonica Group]